VEDIKKLVEVCRTNRSRFDENKEYVKPISFWSKTTTA
jgi:hypothetical protein